MFRSVCPVTVDPARCTGCGLCTGECGVLELNENRIPQAKPEAMCNVCGHCFMVCPAGAISIDGVRPEDVPVSGNGADFDKLLNLVRSRRSVRRYKRMNVKREDVQKLLDALRFAPTGVNDHRLFLSVIDDISVMDEFRARTNRILLDGIRNHKPGFEDYASIEGPIGKGIDVVFRSAPHMLLIGTHKDAPTPAADPFIALSYFELLANSMGIATCWCGRIMNIMHDAAPELYSAFRLPDEYVPSYAILFGYADVRYLRTFEREAYPVKSLSKSDVNQ